MRLALLATLSLVLGGAAFAADTKDPNAGVVTDPATVEVWTTDKGSKYHTKDCTNAKIKETLAEALVDADTPCSKCSPPVYDPAKITVFASDSGAKYHLFSCRFAKKPMTLLEAIKQDLAPCGVCKPPVVWKAPAAPAADPAKPAPAK